MVRRKHFEKEQKWLKDRDFKGLLDRRPSTSASSLTRAFDYLPDLDDVLEPVLNIFGSGFQTQDDADDDLNRQMLYGVLRGEIVGLRYYKGLVNNGEMVSLVRQPDNQYDRNAVKVDNVIGEQVGHIKKELARPLAVIMDKQLARVEGVVPFGDMNVYSMPIDLTFWGQPENKIQTIETLRKCGFMMLEGLSEYPRGASKSLKSGQSVGSGWLESATVKRTFMSPAEVKNELDKLFENLSEGDKTSECDPCEAIVTPLFSHQKRALCWMMKVENSDTLPPFWANKAGNYFNSIAGFTTKKRPLPIRGGILADDMGLGKTLEIISLILTNFEKEKPLASPVLGYLRPSKMAKMERLKIYRLAASDSTEKDGANKDKEEDADYIPSSSSGIIRKPLVLLPSAQNLEPCPATKTKELAMIRNLSEPALALPGTGRGLDKRAGATLPSAAPNPIKEVVILLDGDETSQPSNDPDYKSKEGKNLPSPNVKSRPKRNVRRPAHYANDAGDDDEDEVQSSKKLRKELMSVQMTKELECEGKTVQIGEKSTRRGRKKASLRKSVTAPSAARGAISSVISDDIAALPVPETDPVSVSLEVDCPKESLSTPVLLFTQSCPVAPVPAPTSFIVIDEDGDLPDLDLPDPTSFGKQCCNLSTGRSKSSGPRPTLIICPLSTLSNWLDQIEEHVDKRVMLQVYLYYGASRTQDYSMLAEQDIVLTTYQTLSSDFKGDCYLQKVHWLRIVLDEGHTIRNPSAQMTKAILALQGDRKWVVTGTPIQNTVKDLWPLVKFLNINPFEEKSWWDRTIARPLLQGDSAAVKRVQSLLGIIALRRMKTQIVNGKPLVDLPPKEVFVETIRLSSDERKLYDTLQNEGKLVVSKYCQQGTLLNHYGEVMSIMMRLRQLCLHPCLVVKAVETAQKMFETAEDTLSEEFRQKLIEKILLVLNSGSDEECPICLDQLKDAVITHCAHVFCLPCIEKVIRAEGQLAKCPMCRGHVSLEKVVEVPPDYKKDDPETPTNEPWQNSSKITSLMHALFQQRAEDRTVKSIIVSQFTSFLTLLEMPLRENGFRFVRLDGKMSSRQRSAAIEAFSDTNPSSPTIFLLSLKAGGVGINLTAASRVFLMDPAWNPASEDQCFDRCHRLGQTRPVVITKYVVENSIEEKMIALQDKKRELVRGVFGEEKQTADQKRKARIDDIKNLMDLSGDVVN